jgi:hypothetical protein
VGLFEGKEEAMSTRAAWLLCGILVVGVCTVLAFMAPAGLPHIHIVPPSPDLAPGLAGLSGVWEASEGRPGQVVVERINETRAVIVHSWADQPPGDPSGGWERVMARVLPNGGVQWGFPVRFTLRLAKDGVTLEGQIERAGVAARTILKKKGASVALTGSSHHTMQTTGVQWVGD